MIDSVSIIVTLIRVLVPFSILKWPFLGAIAAMLVDSSDVMIFEHFGYGYFNSNYHIFDKIFDIYYLFFEFLIVFQWRERIVKNTGIFLFTLRLVGFVLFELTGIRKFLFFAPNIFEFFFLFYTGARFFYPKFLIKNKKRLILILLIIGIPNIIKEYIMHFMEFRTWDFFRDNLFWWLYN